MKAKEENAYRQHIYEENIAAIKKVCAAYKIEYTADEKPEAGNYYVRWDESAERLVFNLCNKVRSVVARTSLDVSVCMYHSLITA